MASELPPSFARSLYNRHLIPPRLLRWAESGNTADSISNDILSYNKSLGQASVSPRISTCLHSFGVVQVDNLKESKSCQTCNRAESDLECTRCATQQCRLCYNEQRPWSARFDLMGLSSGDYSKATTLRLAAIKNELDAIKRFFDHSAQSNAVSTLLARRETDAANNDSTTSSFCSIQIGLNHVIIETSFLFPVNVFLSINHLVTPAAEIEGDRCYVSEDLIAACGSVTERGSKDSWACVTWGNLYGHTFLSRTWCQVLERSQIRGRVTLILGKDREQGLKTSKTAKFLPQKPLPPSPIKSQKPDLYQLALRPRMRIENCAPISDISDSDISISSAKSEGTVFSFQDTGYSSGTRTNRISSSTSSSSESCVTAEGFIEARREQIIGKIISDISQWLRTQFIQAHGSTKEAATNSSDGANTSSDALSQPSKGRAQPSRKRKLGDREGGSDKNDDDESDKPSPLGGSDKKGKEKAIVRFACPYFKYNPTKYQGWATCPGPGWQDVHRVKEHLYRRHRQPKFRCGRCWEQFESEQTYVNHQRAEVICELRETELIEGFDGDQEKQLKSRKKKSYVLSEPDKWRAAFQILFPLVPADEIPSPYYEYDKLASATAQSQETLTECQEYVLREIPLRLYQILTPEFDRDIQIVEQSLKHRAIEHTKELIASLFQEFRQRRQELSSPAISSQPSRLQGHAGSSLSQAPSLWFNPMGFLDQIDLTRQFSLDDASMSIFEPIQLEDVQAASTHGQDCVPTLSDSGYSSKTPERPEELVIDEE